MSETEQQGKNEGTPRERILQAALELFVEQGYFNTNIPDVSKRSRCSVGSIYHHFLNKEEIAQHLHREAISHFRAALFESIAAERSLEQTIKKLVAAFLRFAETHHLYSRYLWLSRHAEFLSAKVSQPTTVGFDSLGRHLTRAIKQGIRAREIPALRAPVIWTLVFGLPNSYIRDWLDGYTTLPPSDVAEILSGACWQALKAGNAS